MQQFVDGSFVLQLVFHNGEFENLPAELVENFRYRTIVPVRENILNFYTDEEYDEICAKAQATSGYAALYIQQSTMKLPEPDTIEDFMRWYLPTCLYIYDGEVRMRVYWEGKHLQLKVLSFDEWE